MSRKNILKTEKLDGGKVHVTFETDEGPIKYEYRGSSARAFLKGADPSDLSGKKVKTK